MPQLDIFTFLPQIFWFLVFYFVFYIFFLRFILIRIFISLRTRNSLLNLFLSKGTKSLDDYLYLRNQYILVFIKYFENSYNRYLEINNRIYIKFKLISFLKILNLMDRPFMVQSLQSLYIKIELLKNLSNKNDI